MPTLEDVLARYASLSEARLSEPWRWPGRDGAELEVRDAVLRSLELELAAAAGAGAGASEAARATAVAQAVFGDLRGLLCGLADAVLDEEPGGGEWTLRRVLQHVLLVERRYQLQTAYAVRRTDPEPVRREPAVPAEDGPATVAGWLELLSAVREEGRELAAVAGDRLTRPTIWAGHAVDVRFRLHRFTGHLVQHTLQCEKVLARAGHPEGEARRLARRISAARGGHEWLSDPALLAQLDEEHRSLADSLFVRAHDGAQ
jgi:DinB superfamily